MPWMGLDYVRVALAILAGISQILGRPQFWDCHTAWDDVDPWEELFTVSGNLFLDIELFLNRGLDSIPST